MPLTPARRAELALLLVTLMWGITFPLIKGALDHAPPLAFLGLRFTLAFLLLWPVLRFRRPGPGSWGAGVVLTALMALSYIAQTTGLQYTTATRSAFITGLSVVIVPLLYPFFARRAPGRWPAAGAALATAGMYLLADPRGGGLNRGDALTLLCALAYALYILVLERVSARHAFEDLVVIQLAGLAAVFVPLGLLEGGPVRWGAELAVAVAVTALILAATLYLQNRYQKDTTAPRAAVIFAAEPVFAALFAFVLLSETLAPAQWGGGVLILAGILVAEKR